MIWKKTSTANCTHSTLYTAFLYRAMTMHLIGSAVVGRDLVPEPDDM